MNWENIVSNVVNRQNGLRFAAAAGVIFLGYKMLKRRSDRCRAPLKADFKEDVVYLYQFPPISSIPCISPFAQKVELFLRFANIPYEVTRVAGKWSSKGQIPFIEVNGKETGDSELIIDELRRQFNVNLDDDLTEKEKATGHAVAVMLNQRTSICYFYHRYVTEIQAFIDTWKPFAPALLRRWLVWSMPGGIKNRAVAIGVGRNTPQEIADFACADLKSVSDILGDSKYLLGDSPSSYDCSVFAHLAQILAIREVNYPQREYMKKHCPNLMDYFERIKAEHWSTWDSECYRET